VINHTRTTEKYESGRPLAIALDTKRPETRIGNTVGDVDNPISAGHHMIITTNKEYPTKCDDNIMYMDYKNLPKVIEKGRINYVDDGVLSFEILAIPDDQTVKVKCLNNGKISSKKGVNLPKTDVDLPPLPEKDKGDLLFGVRNGVHMIFASFTRRGSEL
jgi:pyruvate kinase